MLDTLPEIIAAGTFLLLALLLILRFASRGGRVKTPVAELAGISEPAPQSADTVTILAKLEEMNKERKAAREQAAEKEKNNERRWKKNFTILDAMASSMLANGIGNGELTTARDLIAECKDDQVEQLIEQGGGS